MSREIFTINPQKQVLLTEKDYNKLVELANANDVLIEQKAKEMYQSKGTASLSVCLDVREGFNHRNYERIRISDPMLIQGTDLGSIPKESINQINSAVKEMLVDFYKEHQRPIDEALKEHKKLTSMQRFWSNMALVVIVFGVLCGCLMSVVFNLLK